MKLATFALIALLPLALPVATAAGPVIPPPPVEICLSQVVTTTAEACAGYDWTTQCASASATVYSRNVVTPGASATTPPVNVGPLHVSSTTVTLDPVWVITIPQRGFTNDFCLTMLS